MGLELSFPAVAMVVGGEAGGVEGAGAEGGGGGEEGEVTEGQAVALMQERNLVVRYSCIQHVWSICCKMSGV